MKTVARTILIVSMSIGMMTTSTIPFDQDVTAQPTGQVTQQNAAQGVAQRDGDARPRRDFSITFNKEGMVKASQVNAVTRGKVSEAQARAGEEMTHSNPLIESVIRNMGRKLSGKIRPTETLTLYFSTSGDVSSSNNAIFNPQSRRDKYDDYKQCVGDNWWAPGVAQVCCLVVFA